MVSIGLRSASNRPEWTREATQHEQCVAPLITDELIEAFAGGSAGLVVFQELSGVDEIAAALGNRLLRSARGPCRPAVLDALPSGSHVRLLNGAMGCVVQ